tara:strand:- start:286 stop:561 length:276 start_codon:yes stop_codon:yes gene_type:complete
MHQNLFQNGHAHAEVYEAIRADYARDSKAVKFFDAIWIGALIAGLIDLFELSSLWFVLAAIFTMISLRYFVDQSNRNHMLHRIDWDNQPFE